MSTVVAGNLPVPIASFVGREEQLEQLTTLLRTTRLVTLTGPGGVGKTRLALEAAALVQHEFTDGAWWVELANVNDPSLVSEAVASALQVPLRRQMSLREALVAHLRNKRVLIVLDNCEHVGKGAAEVARTLLPAVGGLSILATSQKQLGVHGERIWKVRPLSAPADDGGASIEQSEAVQLFWQRAVETGHDLAADPGAGPAAAEICRRLDGLPLAIELAAARVGPLSVTEVAQRIDDRFRLLAARDGGLPGRHQSLEAALTWSYQLLAREEQSLLRYLSVFAGGCTLDAAEEVCAHGEVRGCDVFGLLESLVSRSLVVADPSAGETRYRLLETVRGYATERLVEAGEETRVHARHASWCVAVAEKRETIADVGSWLRTVELEQENIKAALEWAISNGRLPLALRLGGALSPFWLHRGRFGEGREWLAAVLSVATERQPMLTSRALMQAAVLGAVAGDAAGAMEKVEESLALAREAGDDRGTAAALNLLGFLTTFSRGSEEALPRIEESVALERETGSPERLAGLLASYGRAHKLRGDAAAAKPVFEECRELAEQVGDRSACCSALLGLAWVSTVEARYPLAEELLQQALTIAATLGAHETAVAHSYLGEVARCRGDHATARTRFNEGMALARSMGSPYPLTNCLRGLGQVALTEGDTEAAHQLMLEAVTVAADAGLHSPHALALVALARVNLAESRRELAAEGFEAARAMAGRHGDARAEGDAVAGLGIVAAATGDLELAGSHYYQALSLHFEAGDRVGTIDVLANFAALAAAQGDWLTYARLSAAVGSLREVHGAADTRAPGVRSRSEAEQPAAIQELGHEGFTAAWDQGAALSLEEAVSLVSRGRGPRQRPSTGWESLTRTEVDVATLAARGLTNREIGERLIISPRTVQGHLQKVFVKLGLHSRRNLRALFASDTPTSGR